MDDFAVQLMKDVPEQFKNQDKIRVLINALAAQLNDLATFYRDLITARTIAGAQGKQLDYIGDIVDLNRAEATAISTLDSIMDDDLYRRYLLYKIALNTSNCTLQDIYDAIHAFAKDVAYYKEDIKHQATIILKMTEDMYKLFQHFKFAKAAGVKLDIETYPTDNGDNFGLKSFFSYLPIERATLDVVPPDVPEESLMFSSDDSFSLEWYTKEYYWQEEDDEEGTIEHTDTQFWDGTIEWSTDAENWQEWDINDTLYSGEEHRIYLRGIGNTYVGFINANEDDYEAVPTGIMVWPDSYEYGVHCTGNIESLLDHETVEAGLHPQMADGCFKYLFCKSSIRTLPTLGATTLSSYCYAYMFAWLDCYSEEVEFPSLPATTLAPYCYSHMFYEIYAVAADAPVLPATTLASYCYAYMFSGYGGTTVPELPATTLAEGCYMGMFSGYQGTTVPELPATTLAPHCYANMFSSCDSLETLPVLSATTLAAYCYDSMFSYCAITSPPSLPATTLAPHCYDSMFLGCTSLETMPTLPALTLAPYCYSQMFYGCEGLVFSQAPVLPATTLAPYCYRFMFAGDSRSSHWGVHSCQIDVPPVLAATALEEGCYYGMFSNCLLASAPQLPATVLAESCYVSMFADTDITAAPDIPATVIEKSSCQGMFSNCASLQTPAKMPATRIKELGCYSMYWNCTSLSALPVIYATQIDGSGYGGCDRMFDGCTSIEVSETSDSYYRYTYKIPNSGSSVIMDKYSINQMFINTGGTFSGSIHPPKTLYTTNPPLAV